MKKKTVVIVSLALVFALLAIAVIATFPTYLLEEKEDGKNHVIQSGNINSSNPSDSSDVPEVQGEDVGTVGDDVDGVEVLLPSVDDPQDDISDTTEDTSSQGGLQTVAKTKSAVLKAEINAFDDDVKVKLKKLGILNKDYYRARHYTEDIAKNFVAYKYTAKKDGKDYQTSGLVKLIINVPENYDINNTSIYYLFDGYVQELDCSINEVERTISTTAVSTGVYILVEKKPETDKDTPSPSVPAGTTDSSDNVSDDNSSDSSNESASTPSEDNSSSSDTEDTSSNTSDTSSENTSSDASSDTSSDASSDTSSDASSSDPNKESMNGWSPWF